jgi:hypothetical protein
VRALLSVALIVAHGANIGSTLPVIKRELLANGALMRSMRDV